jgi:hypothetical protein
MGARLRPVLVCAAHLHLRGVGCAAGDAAWLDLSRASYAAHSGARERAASQARAEHCRKQVAALIRAISIRADWIDPTIVCHLEIGGERAKCLSSMRSRVGASFLQTDMERVEAMERRLTGTTAV